MKKFIFVFIFCAFLSGSNAYCDNVPVLTNTGETPAVNKESASAKEQPLVNSGILPELKKEVPVLDGKVQALDGEAPVKIKPCVKISTSNPLLKAGDYVEFEVAEDTKVSEAFTLKKGEKAVGLITKLVDNEFNGTPAMVAVEQFVITREDGVKFYLNGEVSKTGKPHNSAVVASSYLLGPAAFWIRGGEVAFDPKKDVFEVRLNNLRQVEKL